jgi:hypothetical protein
MRALVLLLLAVVPLAACSPAQASPPSPPLAELVLEQPGPTYLTRSQGDQRYLRQSDTRASTAEGYTATQSGGSFGFTCAGADPYCLYGSNANSNMLILSNVSAGNAGATCGTAMTCVRPVNALDATDYVFSVGNSSGTSLFSVAHNGGAETSGVTNNGDYIVSHAAGALYWNSGAATSGQIASNISAANAGATAATAAFKFYPTVALDAADWVLSVNTVNNAASLFNVAYTGVVTVAAQFNTPSLFLSGGGSSAADVGTDPTVVACSGTAASITAANGTAAFQFDVGTSCAGESTAVVTMPAATTGWVCSCSSTTADRMIQQKVMPSASTTTVTLQNIVISTGANGDFADGADVACLCRGL